MAISEVTSRQISTMNMKTIRGSKIDNHANTCVVGNNALITHDYQQPVSVSGYDPATGSQQLKIVSAAVAYDDHNTGETTILMINQAIYVPTVEHNLLCPMQMRLNEVEISECPKFLHPNPTDKTHAIVARDEQNEKYMIPLQISGVVSYFPTRKPTMDEIDDADQIIHLTADQPKWDPHTDAHARAENSMLDFDGGIKHPGDERSSKPQNAFILTITHNDDDNKVHDYPPCAPELDPNTFSYCIKETVNISLIHSKDTHLITPAHLAKNWNIGIDAATWTIEATTQ